MENRNLLNRVMPFLLPLSIIMIAVLLRLVPHAPNFTPIAAMALFGGVYLDKKYALLLPLLVMIVSDLFLGFHQSVPFVYGSILLTGLLGMWLRERKSVTSVITASISSSVLFFLITNFGYWLSTSLYPKTLEGQLQAYYYALPFFRNTLIGDLFYTTLFFGGYALLVSFITRHHLASQKL